MTASSSRSVLAVIWRAEDAALNAANRHARRARARRVIGRPFRPCLPSQSLCVWPVAAAESSPLEISHLQHLAIPDPCLCQCSLGLGDSGSIATRLIDLQNTIIGPAIRRCALECALELILGLGKPARLQQR